MMQFEKGGRERIRRALARVQVPLMLVAVAVGCNPGSRAHPAGDDGVTGAPTPTSTSTPSNPNDAASDAYLDAGGDANDANAIRDMGPPIDAPVLEAGKPGSNGDACVSGPLAWWALGSMLDAAVVPANAVTQLNPLLSTQHPFVVVEYQDAGSNWMLLTTGSAANGIGQQYFPVAHAVAGAASEQRQATSFASTAPEVSAWLRLVDTSQAEVWIPFANASTSATYGDTSCTSLVSGILTAVIPHSASSIPLSTASGSTTIGALFGADTSAAPAGWNIKIGFSGDKVQVSFK